MAFIPFNGEQFLILRTAGEGSYGKVWQVENSKKDIFAIKYNSNSMYADREFDISQAINHKNVIKYERGDIVFGGARHVYLMCPYIETQHIGEIQDQRLLIQITDQLFEAVMAVHEAGYVHMDIKKANILVNVENDQVNLKLIDFSISQKINEVNPWDMKQLKLPFAEFKFINPRFDVYDLGLYLTKLWTGKPGINSIDHLLKSMVASKLELVPTLDEAYSIWKQVILADVVFNSKDIKYAVEFPHAVELLEATTSSFEHFDSSMHRFFNMMNIVSGKENRAKVFYIMLEYVVGTKVFWRNHKNFITAIKAKLTDFSKLDVDVLRDAIPRWMELFV